MSKNPVIRAKLLRDFLAEICRDFVESQGARYIMWQRTYPVDGCSRKYSALGGDGAVPTVYELDDAAMTWIRDMEQWAKNGEGQNPAERWRLAKSAEGAGTSALSVEAIPEIEVQAPEASDAVLRRSGARKK